MTSEDELIEIIDKLVFGLETTNTCLKTWNGGLGGPADAEGICADARKFLAARSQPLVEQLREDAAFLINDIPTRPMVDGRLSPVDCRQLERIAENISKAASALQAHLATIEEPQGGANP